MFRATALSLLFFLVLTVDSLEAQSWEGFVNGIRMTVSGQPGPAPGARGFKVYFNGEPAGSIALRCGQVIVSSGAVLFCSDNLNEFADRSVAGDSYFNFRFSSSDLGYVCTAATSDSPLFCNLEHGLEHQPFTLAPVG